MGILDKLNSENDPEIVEEFLNEWDFIVDDIDLVIERLNNEDEYKESVNELFRIFHSLKAATSFLKLHRINIFAQLVEEVLERARQKDKATPQLIDWLFIASSQLGKWYDEIMKNGELSPINPKILNIPKGY